MSMRVGTGTDGAGGAGTVCLDHDDVAGFALLSGDRNPLHTDAGYARQTPFGEPVAHGALAVLAALAGVPARAGDRLTRLDARFPAPVFPDRAYHRAVAEETCDGVRHVTVELLDGERPVLTLAADFAAAPAGGPDAPATGGAVFSRDAAAAREPEELHPGLTAEAPYAPDWAELSSRLDAWQLAERGIGPEHAAALAWCSYTAGMELPGASSLLSRISLRFPPASGAGLLDPPLHGRAEVTSFHTEFAALTVSGVLRTGGGDGDGAQVLAEAEVQVRARPAATGARPDRTAALLPPSERLAGQVAVVVGGSRGLGAALVQALAQQGCTVYLGYHRSRGAAEAVRDGLGEAAARVRLAGGDCADPTWCGELRERVLAEAGRCDILVLNACPPLHDMDVAADGGQRLVEYVRASLAMVQAPVSAFAADVAAARGAVVGISSEAVAVPPRGWPHYVAAKTALEGLIRSLAAEHAGVRCLLARPPRMRTTLTHAPASGEEPLEPEVAAVTLVARLAAPAAGTAEGVELVDAFPPPEPPAEAGRLSGAGPGQDSEDKGEGREEQKATEAEGHLLVAATFTAEPAEGALAFWNDHLDLSLQVEFTPYGQVFQQLLDSDSAFANNRRGCNLVLLRLEDWPAGDAQRTVDDFAAAVEAFTRRARVPLLVFLCPASPQHDEGAGRAAELATSAQRLRAALDGVAGVHVIDWDRFGAGYRVADYYDAAREELGHIPYTPLAYTSLATVAMRAVRALLRPPAKVLVLDCDNTLWGGVCGEDGADGVTLEEGHLRLQRWALELRGRGVLLCLASKNYEDDVTPVLARPDMVLHAEHIAAQRVNWEPKSLNIAALAAELDVGLDTFVFLDDNPVETAEVSAAHPQVLVLTLPASAADFPALLDHLWAFDQLGVTAEDRRRADYYRAGRERERFRKSTMGYADFIGGLGLDIRIAEARDDQVPRISQLTYRTNQFNTTAVRRTEAEVRALPEQGRSCWTTEVSDRFGDYGLVSIAFTEGREDALVVDGLMMSCRVLGRGVEHAVLAHLGEQARAGGFDRLDVHFRPTERNAPAHRFLESVAAEFAEPAGGDVGGDVAGAVVYRIPADRAAAVAFRPVDQVVEEEKPKAAASSAPAAAPVTAARPDALAAIPVDLADLAEVHARVTGGKRPAAAAEPATSGTPGTGGVDAAAVLAGVREVFHDVLPIPLERLQEGLTLEELGLTSFTIVDLTVSLEKRFGSLPRTLLFEHRTFGGVVAAVADHLGLPPAVARPAREPASAPQPPAVIPAVPGERAAAEPIAVVGVAGRYPGARDLDELARRLLHARSSVQEIPPERWDHASIFDPSGTKPGGSYSKWACLLDDVDKFDPLFFSISPREAELMDPQQRLFLEVAYETLQNAGHTPASLGPDVGVYVGAMAPDYAVLSAEAALDGRGSLPYAAHYQIANRVSYAFDFTGPSLAVDTACSSSGVALHLACQDLRSGRVTAALAGGVNLILHPSRIVQYAHMGMLSRSGRCQAFGAGADGMVMGEGVGAVLLKPLSRALRDGDHVHALIRGTATNSGGRTQGFTVPSPDAQAQLISAALRDADVDPDTVTFVEAHGTGTPLGDPIEIRGLAKAFGPPEPDRPRCAVGSLKTTIGHLEPAAAIAGLTKVLLQLRHRTIMPNPGAETLNPGIDFDATPFFVPDRPMPWDGDGGPRRAGISSFGAGGVNVHVVVEEYTGPQAPRGAPGGTHLVVVSAKDAERLREYCADLAATVKNAAGDLRLSEVAYQLQVRRQPLAERLAVLATDPHQLADALAAAAGGSPPPDCCWTADRDPATPRPAPESFRETVRDALRRRDLPALAAAWVAGADVPWADLHDGPLRHVELPGYPFARERYWLRDADQVQPSPKASVELSPEAAPAQAAFTDSELRGVVDGLLEAGNQAKSLLDRWVDGRPAAADPSHLHPLVHENVSDFHEERFQSRWTGEEPFLREYLAGGRASLPAAAWIEAARAAVALADGQDAGHLGVRLTNLTWPGVYVHEAGAARGVHIALAQTPDGSVDFDCYQLGEPALPAGAGVEDFRVYCQGQAELVDPGGPDRIDPRRFLDATEPHLSAVDLLEAALSRAGIRLGDAYQALAAVRRGDGLLVAEVRLPAALRPAAGHAADFVAHPVLLTAALQAAVGWSEPGWSAAVLPTGVDEVTFHARCVDEAYAILTAGTAPRALDLDLRDRGGRLLVRLSGIRFAQGDEATC